MAQAYLQLRYRSSAHAQMAAFKEVNGQLTQIGGDFGTAAPTTDNRPTRFVNNRITNWQDDIYAVGVTGVWRFDVSTDGPWALHHTFVNPETVTTDANTIRMGLIPVSFEGSPRLVTAYPSATATTDFRLVTITPTGTFESNDITNAGTNYRATAQVPFNQGLQYRNNVVFTNVSDVVELNIDTLALSEAVLGASEGKGLCIFRDNIFIVQSVSSIWRLYRKDGSAVTLIASMPVDGLASTSFAPAVFPFQNFIIIFGYLDGNSGGPEGYKAWACEFAPGATSSPTITEITDPVIPVSLRSGQSTAARSSSWAMRIDPITSGIVTPLYQMQLAITETEGTSVDLYDYVPISGQTLSFVASSMDTWRYAKTYAVDGTGGQFVWPGSGTLNISQPTLTLQGANILAQYTIFGGDSSLDNTVAMQLVYDKEGEHALSVGTINFTNLGALSGVAAVTGLSPGDTFTVRWAAAVDGITNVDNPKVGARVFIP